MLLIQKMKMLEKHIVFMKWDESAEFGKIEYVGTDFSEFAIIDAETLDYSENIIIHASLIREIVLGGSDVGRIIAGVSSKLPSAQENN